MTRRTLYCLLLSSLGITTACVDNSYDLTKDIDMTITVGGDLTTPGSSTEEITLNDLFDVDYETSDLDTTATGDFVLRVQGDPTHTTVRVNDVTVDESSAQKSSRTLIFTKSMLEENGETTPLPIEDLDPEWELRNNEVPEDVVDMEYADDILNNEVTLRLKIEGASYGVWLKKGMTFTFPSYMEVEAGNQITEGKFTFERVGGQTRMVLKEDFHLLPQGAEWSVGLKRIYFKSVEGVTVPAGEGFIPAGSNSNAKVFFDIFIPVEGEVTVKETDFPIGTSQVEFQLTSYVESQEMIMGRVHAIVNPDIDFTVSDVKIENLPDFLTDNDVNADLTNPQVLLRVNNTAEVDVNLQAVLASYKEGVNQEQVIIGTGLDTETPASIRLKASTDNKLCLSPLNKNVPEGYTWVQVEGLPDLVQHIPDLIRVESIETKVLPNFYTLNLGEDKDVDTDYDLNAPLEFGKEFSIVYKDTLDGWSEDMDDFEMKEVEVTLNAINRIPLNLDLTATAIDVNGEEMSDVEVTTEGIIAAGTKEIPSEKVLTFNLKKKDGTRIKNLDGLILRLNGKAFRDDNQSQAGEWVPQTLNASQTLKLEDLKLKIKGGVTLDLN